MYLARFILEEEPLWHEDYTVSLTLSENVLHGILARVTDGPWPECAAAPNEDERPLPRLELLHQWGTRRPVRLAGQRRSGHAGGRPRSPFTGGCEPRPPVPAPLFLEEAGLELTYPAALTPFHTSDIRERLLLPDLYPFDKYDQQLDLVEVALPFPEVMDEFIRRNPDSFR